MDESTAARLTNGIDLEGQIKAEFVKAASLRELRPANSAALTARVPSVPMPEYVQHREEATEIGKLSAEAIVGEYEAAAKDIEEMGAELIERVKQCEIMAQDALAVTKEMKDTAARYREEAKRIFLQIEECSLMTAEVRKTCTELKEKIAAPPTAPG